MAHHRPAEHRDERGTSTSEYAVGTLGAACIGCVLIGLGADADWINDLFDMIRTVVLRVAVGDPVWRIQP